MWLIVTNELFRQLWMETQPTVWSPACRNAPFSDTHRFTSFAVLPPLMPTSLSFLVNSLEFGVLLNKHVTEALQLHSSRLKKKKKKKRILTQFYLVQSFDDTGHKAETAELWLVSRCSPYQLSFPPNFDDPYKQMFPGCNGKHPWLWYCCQLFSQQWIEIFFLQKNFTCHHKRFATAYFTSNCTGERDNSRICHPCVTGWNIKWGISPNKVTTVYQIGITIYISTPSMGRLSKTCQG